MRQVRISGAQAKTSRLGPHLCSLNAVITNISVSEWCTKGGDSKKAPLLSDAGQPSKAGTADSSVMITSAQPFKKLSGDIWSRHHSQANDWLLVFSQFL